MNKLTKIICNKYIPDKYLQSIVNKADGFDLKHIASTKEMSENLQTILVKRDHLKEYISLNIVLCDSVLSILKKENDSFINSMLVQRKYWKKSY